MKYKGKKGWKDIQFIHKVPCNKCGWYNNPLDIRKRGDSKYYRCIKCGNELKNAKDDFIDRLTLLLKGDNK